MKLIIDIPEDVYEKALNGGYKCRPIFDAIDNGIPLEDIRAEIASYKSDRLIDVERNEMIDIVLEIIDEHTKGEQDG